jgi:hypothetical protein
VKELMNEIGPTGIPLSIITKTAEIQFLDGVDKLLLGNKWLRRATGIQPHFPYIVDSFEERYGRDVMLVLDCLSQKNYRSAPSVVMNL